MPYFFYTEKKKLLKTITKLYLAGLFHLWSAGGYKKEKKEASNKKQLVNIILIFLPICFTSEIQPQET